VGCFKILALQDRRMSSIGLTLTSLVWLVACGASDAVSIGPVAASQTDVLTVAEVNANREAVLGRTLRVRGQVHVEQHFSRRPCNEATGEGCDPSMGNVVQLVTPGQPVGADNVIDLYRSKPGGEYEPIPCTRSPGGAFDCGGLAIGTVTVVEGELRKQRIVTGRIIHPDGTSTPTEFRDAYFLVVRM
jgi:hypothetical protein